MPIKLNKQRYYRTSEVCRLVGISRASLLRWISNDIIKDALNRDRRGWRLFTQAEIKEIEKEVNHIR
jgi:DNA-binding transcriptional MerR regulator